MRNWSWPLDPNKSEVPPIFLRRSVSIRDKFESSLNVIGGKIGENEASSKEVEAQAQAVAAMKKRKRAKEKSPIWIGPQKRKRLESASLAQDPKEVSIHYTPGLPVFSFVLTHNSY